MASVLIIDDEMDVRVALGKVVEQMGHEVVAVSDGRKGLSYINDQDFDLVVTDILMPEKEGIETIVELRRSGFNGKVIAISGGGRAGCLTYLESALMLGADAALSKPFSLSDIRKVISEQLGLEERSEK